MLLSRLLPPAQQGIDAGSHGGGVRVRPGAGSSSLIAVQFRRDHTSLCSAGLALAHSSSLFQRPIGYFTIPN
jgi:hypothetical protein